MTTASYAPRPDSCAGRVIAFFRSNPDEELTRGDVASKFGVAEASVDTLLRGAVDAGLLLVDSGDHGRVWSAGRSLAAHAPPQPQPKAARAPAQPVAALPAAGALLTRIEAGVPVPAPKPRGTEYHAVWQQMAPGDSVKLEPGAAKRLIANAQAWGKSNGGRKFTMRQLPDGDARIWRTA